MAKSYSIQTGDVVKALGHVYTIQNVLSQDVNDRYADIEFVDTRGNYHHYKSSYDGGEIHIAIENGEVLTYDAFPVYDF